MKAFSKAIFALLFFLFFLNFSKLASAIEDPLSVANNKYGIHIISASPQETDEARQLVNSNGGDWGYVTFVIESNDRKVEKWQQFFDSLRKKHLIPIVRLATKPSGSIWEKPTEQDATDWANFLSQLNWPVKNRYVLIYNEPNHSNEWGGQADPISYAQVLDQTINALKAKSPDFFVLNAGLDVSTPHEPPNYYDAKRYLTEMNTAVPGIFNKLDGWSSHSYPNPGFVGSPYNTGRGTIRTFNWELETLKSLGLSKPLPVFITETGWKHSRGISINSALPSPEKVAEFYKIAFERAWGGKDVVAVTPFLLNYQQPPFDHFSFKKIQSDARLTSTLGVNTDPFHPQYYAMVDLPKNSGAPAQTHSANLIKGEVYQSIAVNEEYEIPLTFKNTGQSIWNDQSPVKLVAISGGQELNFHELIIPPDKKVEPNQEYTFDVKIKAIEDGRKAIVLNLFSGNQQFESSSIQFDTEAKAPVSLIIKTSLKWKDDSNGDYTLSTNETINKNSRAVIITKDNQSEEIQAHDLLPDYTFTFTLRKPYYQPKTIQVKVTSGINTLDFGELEPNIPSALLNPKALWNLLPISN